MTMTEETRVSSTVPLRWDEVFYTNCPMVSASNIDQELGWCREEYKKIGVDYAYFRSGAEINFYPHYVHNLDNLILFGGLYPPIAVQADIRRTRLLGTTRVACSYLIRVVNKGRCSSVVPASLDSEGVVSPR